MVPKPYNVLFLCYFFLLAYSFMCYVCQEQESNKDCLTISMCSKEDKYCVTIRNNIGTGTLPNTGVRSTCSSGRCAFPWRGVGTG
uniref:Snake toxin/toxin-like domain-containing protein n=1 Tax=Amazona collaria TaxID=241587 RepID=A0A8B9EYU9_9PSIT